MKAIADAIRSKGNTSASLTPAGMASAIGNISTGVETGDATATASDILSGKTAYAKGSKITGTIASKSSSDLTASGATVTVPAGHYASQTTKSVSTATQATPSVSVDSSGKITASATQTAGYVSAGTKTGTKQLTTQAAKTVTPSTSEQTAVASGVYTTGAVKVSAVPTETKTVTPTTSSQNITPSSGKFLSKVTVNAMPTATQATPSVSVDSSGKITASATQTAGYVSAGTKTGTKQLTTQAAKTVTPSTSEQTAVASGVYTTGAVKVAGDANLIAENIAKGVGIFGVVGSYESEATIRQGSFYDAEGSNLNLKSVKITGLGGKPKSVFIMMTTTGTVATYQQSTKYNKYLATLAKVDDIVHSVSVSYGSSMFFYMEAAENPTLYNLTMDDDGFTICNGSDQSNIYLNKSDYRYFAIM